MNTAYNLLDYGRWNRRLINLYWICSAIVLVIELVIAAYYYNAVTATILNAPLAEYVCRIIVLPCVIMLLLTALCKAIVSLLQKKYRHLQPYVITLTCVALSTVLVVIHYGINVIFVTCVVPIIFSLAYDNKKVLSSTFIFSFCGFIGAVLYLNHMDLPIKLDFAEIATNIAILLFVYLICMTIMNRYREIITTMTEAASAKIRAEALAETRSRFLANMSHEIRTPMNGIIGLAELALNENTLSEREENYLTLVRNSAIGLLDIVNDILDISKIDAGEIRLDKIPFDLHELLAECEALITPGARQKGLRLYFYNEAYIDGNIIGTPTRLRQALLNLLSNAVKFTNKGSVTLLVKTLSGITHNNKVSVYFEISDTGIGIANEHIESIFDPFRQADDSVTREFGGTGLGLSITKSIIAAMGGEVEVNSIPNVGSRFFFSLELELSHNEIPRTETAYTAHPFFIGDVLLCEDNKIGRQVALVNLERLGLRVSCAENGKAAVDMVSKRAQENKTFDIIFMDIHMPVMDGLHATKKLMEMGVRTPIIAMTANVMAADRQAYLNAGMAECLYKPFRARELWSCLLRYMTPVGTAAVQETLLFKADKNAPVDITLGLENNIGSEKFYYKSLKIFTQEQQKMLAALEAAVADADFSLANKAAHTLKNNAKIIGASNLSELAAVMEESLRRDGSYYRNEMLDEYKEELAKVLGYIPKIKIKLSEKTGC